MLDFTRKRGDENPRETPAPSRLRWGYPVGLAVPLIVLNAGWVANSEMLTGITEITIATLFTGVLFLLFVLTLLNLCVRRFFGARAALSQPELLLLYTMLSISSAVAGIGNFGFFAPHLANLFWFSKSYNWSPLHPLIPHWLLGPRDPAVLKGFYLGHSTFFQADALRAWAMPLLLWAGLFLTLLWTLFCATVLLRRRWQEEEHLPFPVVALPLEMTREDAPLYRNRLMWLGFLLPCGLHTLNTLHGLIPTLPSFPINREQDFVSGLTYPWTGLGSLPVLVHPAGIGFGYLIGTETLFSLWFFFLVKKILNLIGVMQNWRDAGGGDMGDGASQFPYTNFQAWGAWLMLGAMALWIGRATFTAIIRRAWRGEGALDGEALPPRTAAAGLAVGFLLLSAFVWAMGGAWWLPPLFFLLYLWIMLALTRLHAETAVLSSQLGWVNPQGMMTGLLGTVNLSKFDLAHLASLSWFNLDYRAAPMPHLLEGQVALKRAGAGLRPLTGAVIVAALVAVIASILWDMQLYYVHGAATAHVNGFRIIMGNVPWWTLNGQVNHPAATHPMAVPGMLAGAGMTLLLTALRARFVGFPLTAAGYVLNTSWANDLFWLDMFLAWLVKANVLRYGGIKIYRLLLPFFLGLILGDFVTGAFWTVIGAVFHLELYRTFAN